MFNQERDIEYWRGVYLLHANTFLYKKKIEKSRAIISEFLNMGLSVYGSISGGKDSTAMMHLINTVDKDVPFMSEKDDMDFPNEMDYMQKLAEIYDLDLDIISPSVSLWEEIKNVDFTEDIHSRGTSFSDRVFYGIVQKYRIIRKTDGVFIGLRAEESRDRKENYKKRGFIYQKKNGEHVCQPIAEWSAKDVFAYLFSNDIPILDVYFKTKFVGSPEEIRKSWVLPSHQSSKGQALWLKYYYPDIFERLCLINPKMRGFT